MIERNAGKIDATLKRSQVLRKAILKDGFTDRLVPQDPSDEPAAALLARIKSAQTTSLSAKPARPKGRKASASAP